MRARIPSLFSESKRVRLRGNATAVICLVGLLFISNTRADAGLQFLEAFLDNNTVFVQSSGAAPISPDHYTFRLQAYVLPALTPGPTIVSVSYPGPDSPLNLSYTPIVVFSFLSANFASETDLHAVYPFGTYAFTASSSDTGESQHSAIDYKADFFTSAIPALTAQSYADLQGMTASVTVQFNSWIPAPPFANTSDPLLGDTTLTIFDLADGHIAFREGVGASKTSIFVPADALQANTQYGFDLVFHEGLFHQDLTNNVGLFQSFNVVTEGSFITGAIPIPPPFSIPEPSGLVLASLGLAGLWWKMRRAICHR